MIITDEVSGVRQFHDSITGQTLGLVPTMGYLHEGHLSLIRRAAAENDYVAVSIYINPRQFAPGEDLDQYPRDLQGDLALLRKQGVAIVFTPSDRVMYPEGFQTTVKLDALTRRLEGLKRPAHFDGVTTIVAKLFNIFQPNRAYFGQKDAQQVVVIRQMVIDLNLPLEIVVCPIVREPDGLAMSSRNRNLTAEQRRAAAVLSRALLAARDEATSGQRSAAALRGLVADLVAAEPRANLDYVSVADAGSLIELEVIERPALVSMAVHFGKTRLIDNIILTP